MADSRSVDLDIEGLENPVEVGVGGFATVYKAYQPAFRRTVAVKVLATLNLDDAARERFERECQAMGSLSEHPNIVTVYGAGFTRNDRPYLVMAFLPGGSLQERLDNVGPLPWPDATLAGVHLAGALETAHRAQIVHRDIKPGNVLMSTYGDAQLTDFGIARIHGGHETRSGVITASMAHAPPEVLDGQRPTVSADVYSLGSTIFELMSGTPAFASDEDESMVPMLRRILTEAPPDLRGRGVPDQVCQVIERAMAKDPAQRQVSAVQFGRELQAARRALGVDPGKLTVPSDVSLDIAEGEEINFVAAPFTAPIDAPPPAAAGAVTTAVPTVAPGPPGPTPDYATAPPPSMPAYAAPAAYPDYATGPGAPGSPAGAGTPAPKGRAKGLLVGVAVLVALLLVALGAVAVVTTQRTDTATSSTTAVTTAPTESTESTETTETTETTEAVGYTAETEASFVDTCVKNAKNTRLFCRCVFKGVKEKIDYQRYLQIEADLQNGLDVSKTEVQPIIVDCSKRNPTS
jgi:serine/threonine-protein kinase PknK